jgi:hypothetical protein
MQRLQWSPKDYSLGRVNDSLLSRLLSILSIEVTSRGGPFQGTVAPAKGNVKQPPILLLFYDVLLLGELSLIDHSFVATRARQCT